MKTIVAILLLGGLLTCPAFGGEYPVDKGATVISGTFSVSGSTGDLYEHFEGNPYTTTRFAFNPSVMTFVVPNSAIGAQLGIAYSHQGLVKVEEVSLGAKVGYFAGNPSSKVYPFFVAGLSYVKNSCKIVYPTCVRYEAEYTTSGARLSYGPGFSLMLSSNMAIICEMVHSIDRLESKNKESRTGHIFAVNLGLASFVF